METVPFRFSILFRENAWDLKAGTSVTSGTLAAGQNHVGLHVLFGLSRTFFPLTASNLSADDRLFCCWIYAERATILFSSSAKCYFKILISQNAHQLLAQKIPAYAVVHIVVQLPFTVSSEDRFGEPGPRYALSGNVNGLSLTLILSCLCASPQSFRWRTDTTA